MSHFSLHCTRCGHNQSADMRVLLCVECRSPLDVQYQDMASQPTGPQPPGWVGPPIPLPVHDPSSLIGLGEGDTPVVELAAIGSALGLAKLHAKVEYASPTGSFKDRGTAVMLAVAREQGISEIVEDSSGNAGASVSAYAARAGIEAHVFAPDSAPAAKLQQIRVYGAQAHLIPGPRHAATDAAAEYCSKHGLVYASHTLSPYFVEGTKSFAYEVAREYDYDLPRDIVFPVGNGGLLLGAWKAFRELRARGLIKEIPRLNCVQSRAVMPIVAAHHGEKWEPGSGATTIAGGISVAAPPRLHQIVEALESTHGSAVAVTDEEIVRWQRLLAEREGVYGEPTSAAALAGLDLLVGNRTIAAEDAVLVPITGFGLKDAAPG